MPDSNRRFASLPFSFALFVGTVIAFSTAAPGASPDRISGSIAGNGARRGVRLSGNVHPNVRRGRDRGAVSAATPVTDMRLMLQPTPEQSAALEQLIEDQRNPSSADYHNWLTPEEFADRFGVGENDMAKMRSWLESEGFHVTGMARARNWIAFGGTAAQVARTFQTQIRRYEVDGETHLANDRDPAIPEALSGVVASIAGLDDFRPKPRRVISRRVTPEFNASGGAHYLAPDDLAAIYDISALYKAGFDGLGQKIVVGGQTDVNLADIRSFRSHFGLTARDPQVVLAGSDPGVSSGDQVEADLDLQWTGAVARNATIIYVNSPNVFQSVQYAIDQNLAPVISLSYGACETGLPASYRSMAQQANAQGITWVNSSGDSGAAGCDWNTGIATHGPVTAFPADIPEVTAVGGTEFAELNGAGWAGQNSQTWGSATGYLPERAWNDTSASNGLSSTGGGVSGLFPKPWWQSGPGVPNDGARDVPDISLTASGAHDGYLIYSNGNLMSVGGTSASAPSFAGILGILNQYLVSKGLEQKPGLGNVNPTLYSLAQSAPTAFHDIVSGDNIVPCSSGSKGCPASGSFGYKAGVGYDLATGLGSVDAYNLVTLWGSPTGVGTSLTFSANPTSVAATGTTVLTATVTAVSGTATPTGSVSFGGPGGATLGSAVLSASGTATLTVKGSSLAAGANTITAAYIAGGAFLNSNAQTVVTVAAPSAGTSSTLTASPTTLTAGGSTTLTATVKAATGGAAPAGSVTFNGNNGQLGTATLSSSGVATLTVKASALAGGANSLTAVYGGTTGFGASTSAPVSVTVSSAQSTTTTVTAAASTVNQTGTVVVTATVKPAVTGSVTFTVAGASLGSAVLAAGNGGATASFTVKASSLAAGANTVTGTFAGNDTMGASSGSVTVTKTVPPVVTTTTATASPTTLSQAGSTVISVTVKAADNSVPTGQVSLSAGSTGLGLATLSPNGAASVTVKGSSLAVGTVTIAVSYAGATGYASSSGSVALKVTAPPPATTMSLAASPASIAATASTVLTATVKGSTGGASPTGSVSFTLGNATLGSAQLGSGGVATLTVQATSLAVGSNSIAAAYAGNDSFGASSGQTVVTVTAAPALHLTASPATVAPGGSTQIVATLSGSATVTGLVKFTVGSVTLGTANLVSSASGPAATLTVPASSLTAGANTITAAIGTVTGTTTVTLTGTGSGVAATVTVKPKTTQGLPITVQVQETGGVARTLSGLLINGVDFSPQIPAFFGTSRLPAGGTLGANLIVQWSPTPATLTFAFSGTDASGHNWTQSATASTGSTGPANAK